MWAFGCITGSKCDKSCLWWSVNSFQQFSGGKLQATGRAKSPLDFINKFKIVEEEIDESLFFLELIVEFNKEKREKIAILYKEREEILKMIVASLKRLEAGNYSTVRQTSYVVQKK